MDARVPFGKSLGLETGPAWSWTRWLGSGLHGLLENLLKLKLPGLT